MHLKRYYPGEPASKEEPTPPASKEEPTPPASKEEPTPSKSHSNTPGKSWIKNLALTHEDKDILENGKWLSDAHIHAVNSLLRKQYPDQNGLKSTLHLQFKLQWSSTPDDFIQIINVNGQHWVCASNVLCSPGVVEVYDSIPSYSIGSQSLHRQLAAIIRTRERQFHVRFVDVQRQSGGSDCGLFATAFATALCNGQDPHLLSFEQSEMREHLKECFVTNKLVNFPESRRRRRLGRQRLIATKQIDVFCHCRLTWNRHGDLLGNLIQCEICRVWFHEVCENVDKTKFEHPSNKWYCSKCFSV